MVTDKPWYTAGAIPSGDIRPWEWFQLPLAFSSSLLLLFYPIKRCRLGARYAPFIIVLYLPSSIPPTELHEPAFMSHVVSSHGLQDSYQVFPVAPQRQIALGRLASILQIFLVLWDTAFLTQRTWRLRSIWTFFKNKTKTQLLSLLECPLSSQHWCLALPAPFPPRFCSVSDWNYTAETLSHLLPQWGPEPCSSPSLWKSVFLESSTSFPFSDSHMPQEVVVFPSQFLCPGH
jgi:hypothetical protein